MSSVVKFAVAPAFQVADILAVVAAVGPGEDVEMPVASELEKALSAVADLVAETDEDNVVGGSRWIHSSRNPDGPYEVMGKDDAERERQLLSVELVGPVAVVEPTASDVVEPATAQPVGRTSPLRLEGAAGQRHKAEDMPGPSGPGQADQSEPAWEMDGIIADENVKVMVKDVS